MSIQQQITRFLEVFLCSYQISMKDSGSMKIFKTSEDLVDE